MTSGEIPWDWIFGAPECTRPPHDTTSGFSPIRENPKTTHAIGLARPTLHPSFFAFFLRPFLLPTATGSQALPGAPMNCRLPSAQQHSRQRESPGASCPHQADALERGDLWRRFAKKPKKTPGNRSSGKNCF